MRFERGDIVILRTDTTIKIESLGEYRDLEKNYIFRVVDIEQGWVHCRPIKGKNLFRGETLLLPPGILIKASPAFSVLFGD